MSRLPHILSRRRCLALLAGLLPAAVLADDELRAMSFNLRYDNAADGANAWPHRREAVLALIRRQRPDLLATQEGLLHQVQAIESLGEFGRVGVGRDDGRSAGEHAALFYRLSRFELLASGDFWLSETPQLPSRGWDALCCPRVVSWARLRERTAAGRCWCVLSLHFDHEGRQAQLESARLLRRWLQQQAAEDLQLLLGDFNLRPEAEPMALLREPLRDARDHSETPPLGPAGTLHGFGRLQIEAQPRIDQLLVDPRLRVLGYEVIAERLPDGRYPSDHYPVLARLRPR